MFVIEMQKGITKWVKVWEGIDGADCAEYLKTLSVSEKLAPRNVQFRMRYIP